MKIGIPRERNADQQWPDDAVLQTALAVEDGKIVHPALKNVL